MNHIAKDNPSYLRKKWTSPSHTLPCWEIDASVPGHFLIALVDLAIKSFPWFFQKLVADQMVPWLGKPAAVPEVPGSNPG